MADPQNPDPNSPDLTLEQIEQMLQDEGEPDASTEAPETEPAEPEAAPEPSEAAPQEGEQPEEAPEDPDAAKTIPLAQLLAERRKHKDAELKAEERLAAIQGLLEKHLTGAQQQEQPAQPEAPQNPHDRESEPLEWAMWELGAVKQSLAKSDQERQQHQAETQRQRQIQAFENAIVAEVSEAGQRSREFAEAYQKLNGAMYQSAIAAGLTPMDAGERSKQLQLGHIVEGMRNGRSPVETLIGMCQAYGFAAQQQPTAGNGAGNGQGAPQQQTQAAQMHARGREAAAASLANMTGGSGTAMPSLKAISEMSDADFNANLEVLDKQLRET